MNIQYLKKPFPHIIIDNHYDDWQQKEIWEELDYLTHPSRMVKSNAGDGAIAPDGELLKDNYVVWVDDFFTNRNHSSILRNTAKMYENDLQILKDHGHWYFSARNLSAYNTQLCYYEDSNSYKPHWDVSIVTTLTWFYKKPRAFRGGDLIFPEFDYKVDLDYNRTLIFPSPLMHEVTPIKMKRQGEKLGRYCISQFIICEQNQR